MPEQSGSLEYSGEEQTPSWNFGNTSLVKVTGDTTGTEVDTYNVVCELTDTENCAWADGSTSSKSGTWKLAKKSLWIPVPSELTYNGSSQTPEWYYYDEDLMKIDGTLSATNAGRYIAKISLRDTAHYQWEDGTTITKSVGWEILPEYVDTPSIVNNNLTYNGKQQTLEFYDYDTSKVTISGHQQTDAGDYTTKYALKNKTNSRWWDDTTADKTDDWHIEKDIIPMIIKPSFDYSNSNWTEISSAQESEIQSGYYKRLTFRWSISDPNETTTATPFTLSARFEKYKNNTSNMPTGYWFVTENGSKVGSSSGSNLYKISVPLYEWHTFKVENNTVQNNFDVEEAEISVFVQRA